MNKEQFIKFMESPSTLNEESLPFILEIVKAFPYFQVSHALYAKNLNLTKSIHYQNQLKVTAAYSANRKILYHLLMQEKLTANINKIEEELNLVEEEKMANQTIQEVIEEEPLNTEFSNEQAEVSADTSEEREEDKNQTIEDSEKSITILNENLQNENTNLEKPKTTDQNDSWEKIQRDIEAFVSKFGEKEKTDNQPEKQELETKDEALIKSIIDNSLHIDYNQEDAIITTEFKKEELPALQNTSTPIIEEETQNQNINSSLISDLEKEILTEALYASIELENTKSDSINDANTEKTEFDKSDIINPEPELIITENEINSEVLEDENSENKESILGENHSFSEWLKIISKKENNHSKNSITKELISDDSKTLKTESESGKNNTNELSFKNERNVDISESKKPKPSNKNRRDIIENFIKEDPKISKPKKTDFFSPINMARISVVEDLSFVTETLAKIYEKQGNYGKAINAYENLILKYPEKNVYFAGRIEAIKNLKDFK